MDRNRAKAMAGGSGKVHIINSTTYEMDGRGEMTLDFFDLPAWKTPDGRIWHSILGRYVPADWGDREMWVDESETIFGNLPDPPCILKDDLV